MDGRTTYTEEVKEKIMKWHVCNGMWVRQTCRQYNISTQTFYAWLDELHDKKKAT
jgi:transposase-like protein